MTAPDESRDYFPGLATEPTLVLLDVQLFTRPPEGAATLAEMVAARSFSLEGA